MKKHTTARILGSILLAGLGICAPAHAATHMFAAKKTITTTASANWAGYAASGKGYTAISASWTIPTVTPSAALGVDATWIGIGGVNGSDLIQSGTEAETQNGSVQYDAWTEILPAASKPLAIQVHAGDNVSVALTEITPGQWQIAFANNTTGKSVSKTIAYTSTHSSAEWIEEAPSDTAGVLPIDNFGKVTFSNASVVQNKKMINLTKAGAQAITLAADNGGILAQPSVLTHSGSSFSVTRTSLKTTTGRKSYGGIETWTHNGHGIKKRRLTE